MFVAGEDGQVQFAEPGALTAADFAAVQQQVRARVLRWFARAGYLDPADARDMASWDHSGGFSLDASVRIEGPDRAGLERLLRYCARLTRARQLFPEAGDYAAAQKWAGLRPATPGNVPVIGRTRLPNLFVNTGHGTLGWTLCAGSGRCIADIIAGRPPPAQFRFTQP